MVPTPETQSPSHNVSRLLLLLTVGPYSSCHPLVAKTHPPGFRASLDVLDMATEHFPKDAPVLIVTASFEGQPADNAKHFVEWLENVKLVDVFSGAKYAVFGCGNRDWVATYQRIPTLIDRLLEEHGAIRLVARGDGDAGSAEFFDAFDQWEKTVWEKLATVCAL